MGTSFRLPALLLFQLPAILAATGFLEPMEPGYWPQFDVNLVRIGIVAGVCAAVGSAWRGAAADLRYLVASGSTRRGIMHLFGPPVLVALLSIAMCGAILSLGPLGEAPGGSPTWTIALSVSVWVAFAAVMGTGVGAAFRDRGLLAALLAGLLGIACVLVSRGHEFYRTPVPVMFSWGDGSTVSGQPEERFWGVTVFSAVALGALIVCFVMARLPRVKVAAWLLGSVAVLSIVAGLVAPVGPSLRWRDTDVEVVCTRESRGARVCGWPEELIRIRGLDQKWDEITAAAVEIGAPIPAGITYSEGLRDMPGNHRAFDLQRLTDPNIEAVNIISLSVYNAVNGEALAPMHRAWRLLDFGLVVSYVLYPDMTPFEFTERSEDVIKWVDRVGPGAISGLRDSINRLKDGEDPRYPWDGVS